MPHLVTAYYNMPCMYTPHSHLPLTPPEFYGCGVPANTHYVASRAPEKGAYSIVAPFPPYHSHQASYAGLPPPGITHPAGHYYSNPASATYQRRVELPPIVDNRQRQKEEKTGGVAAHLDYEMEEMTNFVACMSVKLVCGEQGRPTPRFEKFVAQILSSTRLPSSTILLGLVYLRERIPNQGLAVSPNFTTDELLDRMLTVSLLLASKFLDDNTFQNKSWSEVTAIPVLELNKLERAWLNDIGWDLHIDAEGTKGFAQYKAMWENWTQKNSAPALAPISTNLRVRTSQNQFPPVPVYPQHQQHYSPPHSNVMSNRAIQLPSRRPSQDTGYWWSPTQSSPGSAPHTGPPTPEGYFGWGQFPQPSIPAQPQPYSRLPPIMPYSTHHGWSATRCHCWQCEKSNENLFMPSYQSVTA